jgi:hypothetical protein
MVLLIVGPCNPPTLGDLLVPAPPGPNWGPALSQTSRNEDCE